ncbi:hypothetical protein EMPS_06483 [Entomortierella parvispora]|uniref:Uncharacterized protein n=1 Tax=Entomortierella parvispora TaxID=205924 RepID=A0A9P3LXS5_9FUNG|nr:hypothetical protein EMPS_06483 [Entomortierella parvispora]
MATSIPSSLRQFEPSQFAISSILLHNATASPALTISALPPSGFAVRSHTQDRIEYVQDPEVAWPSGQEPNQNRVDTVAVTTPIVSSVQDTTAAVTAATPAVPQPAAFEIPVLLLKVHGDQGFRLTFGLEGRLVEQLSSVAQETGEQQQQQQPQHQQPQQLDTSSLEGGASSSEQRENPPMGNAHKNTSSKEHGPAAGMEGLANTFPHPSQAPDNLFFAETSSEQELENLCQEPDFQSMIKEHAVTTVEFPVIYDGTKAATATATATTPDQPHESVSSKVHAWDWTYTPKDQVDDGLKGHKTVFAFLLRDASSGAVKVLSRFSFWIIDPVRPDQFTGPRNYIPSPSPTSAVHRHWRRASTPERLSSSMNRLTSFQSKLVSIPTSHLSLPSLPEAAAGATGTATGGAQAMSSSTAAMTGDNSQTSFSPNAPPFVPDTEDGPLFRATVVECESHIRDMKASTKRIIKAAQTVLDARKSWTMAEEIFVKELEGFKPAEPLLNAYMRPMTQCLSDSSEKLGQQMRNLLIEPLTRFYENDIKVAESYRKAFDDESKEYYTFLSRYMAMKQESNRKKSDADAKYEKKRRHFELKRFEYWGFLLDMRIGGSKSDEILHHLTNYSEKYGRNIMELALLADELKPGLDGLSADLLESQKRAVSLRRERQERRKELMDLNDEASGSQTFSKSGSGMAMNSGGSSHSGSSPGGPAAHGDSLSDSQTLASSREQSGEQLMEGGSAGQDHRPRPISGTSQNSSTIFGSSPSSSAPAGAQPAKFSGIRDLEHQDTDAGTALGRRKEGFLFATSRPSLHNNSAVLEKPNINWHKYWCVLSEGQLHEYSHWKKGATMPHNDPINLKISTVRACRNQDRRFCFEVITPKFRRVYQATSTEDMNSWISVISNAIQSLLNGTSSMQSQESYPSSTSGARGLEGQNVGGRSSMEQVMQALPSSGHVQGSSDGKSTSDYGSRKGASESSNEQDHYGSRLLQVMRESHPSNSFCAECGAKNPDWCAINLGILICIECSGIHRSLGTHISKVRSFTLDTTSYTRDLFDFIRAVGNNVSNDIWEARLVQTASVPVTQDENQQQQQQQQQTQPQEVVFRKPVVNDGREYKVAFIQKKYIERAFVDKKRRLASEAEDTGAGAEEDDRMAATKLLFKAVVANDMAAVIAAFACGADLNAVEEAELDDGGGDTCTETSESNSVPASTAVTAAVTPEVAGESSDSLQVIEEDSELVSHSPGSETSKSTISSSVLNLPGARGSGQGRSSFRVMETSPLLLALRNGVPFSLDEQYEVYPMAEFMLQNGATSNLSVEVQMIDDELDSNTSIDNSTATDGNPSATDASNKNGWDSTQVDPEDIRHFQQRSNRRSLGQVVHMRGEGGSAAMEYLRGKSAARGEAMPGSTSSLTGHTYGDSKAPIGSSSPPANSTLGNFSPRLRPQTLTVGVSSLSAPTSVVSSPSGPGNYSTTVLRGTHSPHSTSIQQDIASLFQKRRVSDGGLGPALVAAAKATEAVHDRQQSKASHDSGSSQQSPHAMDPSTSSSSSAMSSPTHHRSIHGYGHGHGIHSSSSPHQHSLHASSSRAHKVKATLSKSLRLSAAYLKNNVLKEERDHHPMPVFVTSTQPSATSSSSANNTTHANTNATASSETDTRNPHDSTAGTESEEPLSGPYVILNPKGK